MWEFCVTASLGNICPTSLRLRENEKIKQCGKNCSAGRGMLWRRTVLMQTKRKMKKCVGTYIQDQALSVCQRRMHPWFRALHTAAKSNRLVILFVWAKKPMNFPDLVCRSFCGVHDDFSFDLHGESFGVENCLGFSFPGIKNRILTFPVTEPCWEEDENKMNCFLTCLERRWQKM